MSAKSVRLVWHKCVCEYGFGNMILEANSTKQRSLAAREMRGNFFFLTKLERGQINILNVHGGSLGSLMELFRQLSPERS